MAAKRKQQIPNSGKLKTTAKKQESSKAEKGIKVIDGNAAAGTGLDKLIHERTRLAIISALAVNSTMTFNDLKNVLNVSDGNLSTHARKLEDAGYISCSKGFEDRKPKTEYKLSRKGQLALNKYISHMESLLSVMKNS